MTHLKTTARSLSMAVVAALVLTGCAPSAAPSAPAAAPAQRPATAATAAPPTPTPPIQVLPRAETPTPAAAPVKATPAVSPIKRGGTLKLVLRQNLPNWDPHRSVAPPDMWEYLGNFVVNFDPQDGSPVPDLAESWEFKDAKTLILHIRKGVKFHNLAPVNGREVTADDIVWNLERIRRPGPLYVWKSNFQPIDSFTALDRNTVRVKMTFPFAPILNYLKGTTFPSQAIIAPEVEDKLGGEDAYKDLGNARGTGPFMIKSFTAGVGALAVRNPDYWESGKPYMDAVQMLIVPDSGTMLAAFRVGKVDFGAGSAALDLVGKQDLEKTNPQMKFSSLSDPHIVSIVPNVQRKPFDDVRVRKAMFLALDREEMLNVNLAGGGYVAGPLSWKLFPGWTWTQQELLKREGYRSKKTPEGKQDIAEAQRIMRDLGYGPDHPLVVDADATQYYPWVNLTPLEVAKSELRSIWINVNTIKMVDQTQFFDQEARGDFLLRSRTFTAPMEPDGQLYTRHHTGAGRNFQGLSDPELDNLLDQQRAETDVANRKKLVLKAQERLWSLYPQMWLHTREAYLPQQPWVETQATVWRRWGNPATTWLSR